MARQFQRQVTSTSGGYDVKSQAAWTLMTSHGLVLLYIAANPDATIRETADSLGLTERRVGQIIQELATEDLVQTRRTGKRKQYSLNSNARFRHPLMHGLTFGSFVTLWKRAQEKPSSARQHAESRMQQIKKSEQAC